jgi:copper chaperone CopZ
MTATTKTYSVSGMHCEACVERVRAALAGMDGIESVSVSLVPPEARFTAASTLLAMAVSGLDIASINAVLLEKAGKYSLVTESAPEADPKTASELGFERLAPIRQVAQVAPRTLITPPANSGKNKNWLQTYKPLLVVLGFVVLGTGIALVNARRWDTMLAMNTFMGGFFVAFSFFKMLDVPAFASSYAMYDVVARRWHGWGYVYPFVELALGVAYFTHFAPVATNCVTLVVMSVSIAGVIQSRLQRREIQCACLGTVFQLPMSSVTIVEDGVMIAMSAVMLLTI